MSDDPPPPTRSNFDRRLREAKARQPGPDASDQRSDRGGLGLGLRMASEMVAGLGVGVGVGLALDWWLGTKPWLFIIFFFLGSFAGMLNVYRTFAGYGHAIGYKKAPDEKSEPGSKSKPGAEE